jgi:hypothetical protein
VDDVLWGVARAEGAYLYDLGGGVRERENFSLLTFKAMEKKEQMEASLCQMGVPYLVCWFVL